jgi:hypothetical protein
VCAAVAVWKVTKKQGSPFSAVYIAVKDEARLLRYVAPGSRLAGTVTEAVSIDNNIAGPGAAL